MNFKDFKGLPDDINKRIRDSKYELKLPIPRFKDSARDRHPLSEKNEKQLQTKIIKSFKNCIPSNLEKQFAC